MDTTSSDKELKRNNSLGGLEPVMEVKERDVLSDVQTGDVGLDSEEGGTMRQASVVSSTSIESDLQGDCGNSSGEQPIPGAAERAATHKKSSISSKWLFECVCVCG